MVETQGVANPSVKSHGMWPMFSPVISSLMSPIRGITSDQIENEVKVVLQEIAEKHTNPNYHAYKFIYECVYDKTNPIRSETLGNENDLKSITPGDLQKIVDRVFVPKGFTIHVLTEGDRNLAKKVLTEIKKT